MSEPSLSEKLAKETKRLRVTVGALAVIPVALFAVAGFEANRVTADLDAEQQRLTFTLDSLERTKSRADVALLEAKARFDSVRRDLARPRKTACARKSNAFSWRSETRCRSSGQGPAGKFASA